MRLFEQIRNLIKFGKGYNQALHIGEQCNETYKQASLLPDAKLLSTQAIDLCDFYKLVNGKYIYDHQAFTYVASKNGTFYYRGITDGKMYNKAIDAAKKLLPDTMVVGRVHRFVFDGDYISKNEAINLEQYLDKNEQSL